MSRRNRSGNSGQAFAAKQRQKNKKPQVPTPRQHYLIRPSKIPFLRELAEGISPQKPAELKPECMSLDKIEVFHEEMRGNDVPGQTKILFSKVKARIMLLEQQERCTQVRMTDVLSLKIGDGKTPDPPHPHLDRPHDPHILVEIQGLDEEGNIRTWFIQAYTIGLEDEGDGDVAFFNHLPQQGKSATQPTTEDGIVYW